MIAVLSGISGTIYRRVIKPVLFQFKPDTVHEVMVRTSYRLRLISPALFLINKCWKFEDIALRQEINGIEFSNPVGLTAGVDKNGELPAICAAIGFGMIEVGTITVKACEGNPKPWFHRLPKTRSLAVFAGLANQGVKRVLSRIDSYNSSVWKDLVLNISVGKTNCRENADDIKGVADNVAGIKAVLNHGRAKLITINISCPNTFGGEPFTDPKRLKRLMEGVAVLNPRIPFSVKLPIDKSWPQLNELLKILKEYNFVKFVTIGNLAKDRSKIKFKDIVPSTLKGNFSGMPTWQLSNDLIRQTYINYGDRFTIIGVGGIFTPEDAITKIKYGASLIELATGLIFEGPQLVGQINRHIANVLKTNNIDFKTLVGSDVRT